MKIWLDDEREAPEGWTRVYWPKEAIVQLKTGQVTDISLDHDLGDDSIGTGYDVLLWIEKQVALHNYKAPNMLVHSANPVAIEKMERAIRAIGMLTKKPRRSSV